MLLCIAFVSQQVWSHAWQKSMVWCVAAITYLLTYVSTRLVTSGGCVKANRQHLSTFSYSMTLFLSCFIKHCLIFCIVITLKLACLLFVHVTCQSPENRCDWKFSRPMCFFAIFFIWFSAKMTEISQWFINLLRKSRVRLLSLNGAFCALSYRWVTRRSKLRVSLQVDVAKPRALLSSLSLIRCRDDTIGEVTAWTCEEDRWVPLVDDVTMTSRTVARCERALVPSL